MTFRNFAKAVPQDLMAYLQNFDWSLFMVTYQEYNLDQGLLGLIDSLHGAIDHLAPEKTFQPKKSKP